MRGFADAIMLLSAVALEVPFPGMVTQGSLVADGEEQTREVDGSILELREHTREALTQSRDAARELRHADAEQAVSKLNAQLLLSSLARARFVLNYVMRS